MEPAETLKGDMCPKCSLPFYENHSCLHSMRTALISLKRLINQQHKRIEFLNDSSKSLQEKAEDLPEYGQFKHTNHESTGCDGCGSIPIIGIRYKCKECIDYDLCHICRNSVPHKHSQFYIFTHNNSHDSKHCFDCRGNITTNVLYHCPECNNNLCHPCVKEKGHPHQNLTSILPFNLKVEAYLNKTSPKYKQREHIKITFVIQNLGTQKVRRLMIMVTQGLPPFQLIQKEMDVDMDLLDIRQLDIEGKISAKISKCDFVLRFYSILEEQFIGPDIPMQISVSGGFFGFIKG